MKDMKLEYNIKLAMIGIGLVAYNSTGYKGAVLVEVLGRLNAMLESEESNESGMD